MTKEEIEPEIGRGLECMKYDYRGKESVGQA